MTNEIAKKESFQLATMDNDMASIIAEEMDGLGQMPIETIKIPAGGSTAFELEGEDPDNPDIQKELKGIILKHHPFNVFWANKYDGQNATPDCFSADGKTGIDADGVAHSCDTCPHNQYAPQGGGKECKNSHAIYFLMENSMMPVLVNLPPTSIRPFRDYIAKRVVLQKKRAYQVVTKLSLKKDVNAQQIAYSKIVLTKVRDLTEEEIASVQPFIALANKLATKQTPEAQEAEEQWSNMGSEVKQDEGQTIEPEYTECTLEGMK